MNYGRFFALDVDASDITNGVTVFNYCCVCDGSDQGEFRDTPEFPFSLSFTAEGVAIYLHYADKSEDAVSGVSHYSSLVLSLPTSPDSNLKDELTHNINDIFSSDELAKEENKRLRDLVNGEGGIVSTEDNDDGVSYSSLEVFGIDYSNKTDAANYFLRKLFLDFLFDLEHTSLFENATRYREIRHDLHNNFLFHAIVCKAEYYYQRKQQLSQQTIAKKDNIDSRLFYAEHYITAEENWVDVITHPTAKRCFYESGWLRQPEMEMDDIYISGALEHELPRKKGKRVEKLKSEYTMCSNGYLADIVPRMSFDGEILKSMLKFSESKQKLKIKSQQLLKSQLKLRVRTLASSASSWYIKNYNFGGTVRIWYGSCHTIAIYTILLFILAICSSLIIPSFGYKLPIDQIIAPLELLCAGFGLWLLGLCSRRFYVKRVGLVNSLMPRLLASILAAWFTLAIGEDIFKGFFDSKHSWAISIPLLAILFVFVYYEISKLSPYLAWRKKVSRSLILLIISFTYAFASGIMIIHFFGGNYLERSDYIDEFYVNNVYPNNPEFIIDTMKEEEVLTNIFYGAVERYNKDLVDVIKNQMSEPIVKGDYLSRFEGAILDSCSRMVAYDREKSRDDLWNRINPKSKCDSIDYRVTMLLASQFSYSDTLSVAMLNESQMEGSTLKSRISRVEEYCHDILAAEKSGDLIKIDSLVNCTPIIDRQAYDRACLDVLKSIGSHQTYRDVLQYLRPTDPSRRSILRETKLGIRMFRDMLLQFTFFAMFIGIFIQLIFEEKSITEPV